MGKLSMTPGLKNAIALAAEESRGRRERCTIEHLLLALLYDPDVKAALDSIGAHRGKLKTRLCVQLDSLAPENGDDVDPGAMDPGLKDLFERSGRQALASESDLISGAHVLVHLFETASTRDETLALLADAGVGAADLKWYIAHVMPRETRRSGLSAVLDRLRGREKPARSEPHRSPDGSGATVVVYNDPFTTREFVVEMLTTVFGLAEADATRLMLRVHTQGSAALPGADDAPAKIERVRREAAARGFPLKIELE